MKPNNGLGDDVVTTNDGNVDIALGQRGGKVVLEFFKSIDSVTFDPANAVILARQMIDIAVACGANVTIEVPRRKITKEQRNKLVSRATIVFRSLIEKGKTPAVIARNVVDTILSAID